MLHKFLKLFFPCFAKSEKLEPFKHPQEEEVQDMLNKEREKKMKAALPPSYTKFFKEQPN